MRSVHAPKYAALEAYHQQRLSPEGKRRMERHLQTCETCRDALRAVESYEALRHEARAEELPELAWERLERALDAAPAHAAPAQQPSRRSGKIIALAWPVLAVAATFMLGWFAHREARTPQAVPSAAPAVEVKQARALEGWVTLAHVDTELERAGERAPGQVGAAVVEGMILRTGPHAELQVALGDGSGLIVEPSSELWVAELREHAVRFEVRRGSALHEVRKLAESERYDVTFGPYVASVRGTRYRVAQGRDASVFVFDGRVVVSEGDQLLADLSAGEHWQATSNDARRPDDRRVLGLDPASRSWPSLKLPAVAAVRAWYLGEQRLPAQDALAMRVPPQHTELRFEDTQGKLHVVPVTLTAEDNELTETHIRELLAQQNESRGYLEPAEIQSVVHGGLDAMRRCYERSLRVNPAIAGKLKLAIRVAPDGHVSRVQVSSEAGALPIELEQCLELEARAWRFPRPRGGFVSFELPLNLKAR
jgi:hypothetical protein